MNIKIRELRLFLYNNRLNICNAVEHAHSAHNCQGQIVEVDYGTFLDDRKQTG